MNADRLLAHYERIADVPDAVPRLRRFILDLAVRGKLVAQNPRDSSPEDCLAVAREMLEKKAEQTNRHRWKPSAAVASADIPNDIPPGWVPVRVNDTGLYVNGLAFKPSDWKQTGFPIIRIQNLTDPSKEFNHAGGEFPEEVIVRNGDILVSWSATLEAFEWSRGEGVLNQHIFRVLPAETLTTKRFLYLLLRHAMRTMADSRHAHGLVMTHINRGPFLAYVVLIPPLAEQHRIVAKVDELMALCDRLEKARAEREATRDRLSASSLVRLDAPDPDPMVFRNHAAFALEHLTPLTTRRDQIKALRRTILNLAVRGKLVAQDPNDEPASRLLERITKEKARLVKVGKFNTLDSDLPRDEAGFPFSVPSSWAWCYLDDLAAIARGGSPRPIKSYLTDDPDGIPWIRIGDSLRGHIYIDGTEQRIRPEGLAKSRLVSPGDLLLSNSMSVGYPYITHLEGCIHDGWLVIRTPDALVNKLYLHTLFLSDHAKAAFSEAASGAVVQNLNADKARRLSVPLPPLAEQARIVAMVDELRALCDRLEASLATADDTHCRLLGALLIEALEPGGGRASEQAERAAAHG